MVFVKNEKQHAVENDSCKDLQFFNQETQKQFEDSSELVEKLSFSYYEPELVWTPALKVTISFLSTSSEDVSSRA